MEKYKFYRLMKTPSTNWNPYSYVPMYDENPNLASYRSTMYMPSPSEGDYIVQRPDGILYLERPLDPECYDNVEFGQMPTLQELQADGIVVETPDEIRELDYELREMRADLSEELWYAECNMQTLEDNMNQKKFGFPTKAAREARKEYSVKKPEFQQLQQRYEELSAQLTKQVIAPLQMKLETQCKVLHSAETEKANVAEHTVPIDEQIKAAAMQMIQQPVMIEAEAEFEM